MQVFEKNLPQNAQAKALMDEYKQKAVARMNADDLINLIVPIYDKHFSQDDIKNLIDFYQSPLGKRLLEVTPEITREMMAAGMKWGQGIADAVAKEIEQEHPELKTNPTPSP